VGSVFIATVTNIPEVVGSIAAVRIGTIDLAMGNLFGSNIFNIIILPGTYALAVSHDQNMNGKLDTNWLGIRIEGYCFSNDARRLFGAPSYPAARFS
jgi:Ca2+/Na+ antiporter